MVILLCAHFRSFRKSAEANLLLVFMSTKPKCIGEKFSIFGLQVIVTVTINLRGRYN